jgi:hypothetical protein
VGVWVCVCVCGCVGVCAAAPNPPPPPPQAASHAPVGGDGHGYLSFIVDGVYTAVDTIGCTKLGVHPRPTRRLSTTSS